MGATHGKRYVGIVRGKGTRQKIAGKVHRVYRWEMYVGKVRGKVRGKGTCKMCVGKGTWEMCMKKVYGKGTWEKVHGKGIW